MVAGPRLAVGGLSAWGWPGWLGFRGGSVGCRGCWWCADGQEVPGHRRWSGGVRRRGNRSAGPDPSRYLLSIFTTTRLRLHPTAGSIAVPGLMRLSGGHAGARAALDTIWRPRCARCRAQGPQFLSAPPVRSRSATPASAAPEHTPARRPATDHDRPRRRPTTTGRDPRTGSPRPARRGRRPPTHPAAEPHFGGQLPGLVVGRAQGSWLCFGESWSEVPRQPGRRVVD